MTLSRRAIVAGAALIASRPVAQAAEPVPLRLRRGLNLWPWFSLTREFPAPRTDYAWPPFQQGRPIPTSGDLKRMRESGLDFVRLPVDPGPIVAAAPSQRKDLLLQIRNAVTMILEADLSLVLNIHANAATHHWNPTRLYGNLQAPGLGAYRALVVDLAALLAGFDPARVALEPVNEPPQACSDDVWPRIQRDLLVAARAAAPRLTLVVTGSCGSMVSGLEALDPAPLRNLSPLLYTFHFYEPYLFSHQGAPWMGEIIYRFLHGVPWPASEGSYERTLAAVRLRMAQDTVTPPETRRAALAEIERVMKVYFDAQPARPFIDRYLGLVKAWGERHGVEPARILMGEFGALRSDARYRAADPADRSRYVSDVRRSAESFGFPWAFWNAFDGMGMIDDTTRGFDLSMVSALGLTMPRA